jgi:hypothetical protein
MSTLNQRLDESPGVQIELTLDDRARRAIADACHDLLTKAEDIDLMRIDPVCMGWLQDLVKAAKLLTEQPLDTYEDQLSFGARFMQALAAASCIAARLEAKVPEASSGISTFTIEPAPSTAMSARLLDGDPLPGRG